MAVQVFLGSLKKALLMFQAATTVQHLHIFAVNTQILNIQHLFVIVSMMDVKVFQDTLSQTPLQLIHVQNVDE